MGTVLKTGSVFLLLITQVLGQTDFKCYQCSSEQDSRCGDPFNRMVATYPCPGSCLKFTGERWSNAVRIVEVHRMCGSRATPGCEDGVKFNGISMTRCVCNTNMCNHGNRDLMPSILVMTFLIFGHWMSS